MRYLLLSPPMNVFVGKQNPSKYRWARSSYWTFMKRWSPTTGSVLPHQVGKNLQRAIVEVEEDDRFEMINPEIIASSGESLDVKAAWVFPTPLGPSKRADEITVRYFDREGEEMEVEAFGYLARAMQHEIDHLNGVLFVDKLVERIPEEDLEKYMEEHEND